MGVADNYWFLRVVKAQAQNSITEEDITNELNDVGFPTLRNHNSRYYKPADSLLRHMYKAPIPDGQEGSITNEADYIPGSSRIDDEMARIAAREALLHTRLLDIPIDFSTKMWTLDGHQLLDPYNELSPYTAIAAGSGRFNNRSYAQRPYDTPIDFDDLNKRRAQSGLMTPVPKYSAATSYPMTPLSAAYANGYGTIVIPVLVPAAGDGLGFTQDNRVMATYKKNDFRLAPYVDSFPSIIKDYPQTGLSHELNHTNNWLTAKGNKDLSEKQYRTVGTESQGFSNDVYTQDPFEAIQVLAAYIRAEAARGNRLVREPEVLKASLQKLYNEEPMDYYLRRTYPLAYSQQDAGFNVPSGLYDMWSDAARYKFMTRQTLPATRLEVLHNSGTPDLKNTALGGYASIIANGTTENKGSMGPNTPRSRLAYIAWNLANTTGDNKYMEPFLRQPAQPLSVQSPVYEQLQRSYNNKQQRTPEEIRLHYYLHNSQQDRKARGLSTDSGSSVNPTINNVVDMYKPVLPLLVSNNNGNNMRKLATYDTCKNS